MSAQTRIAKGPKAFFLLRTPTGTRLLKKARVVDVLVRGSEAIPKAA